MNEGQSTRTKMLQKRSERCICKYCGGELEVRSIVFNDIVEQERNFIVSIVIGLNLGQKKKFIKMRNILWKKWITIVSQIQTIQKQLGQMSVAKVCDIMNWIITHLGFVNEDGFCVPVNSDRYMLGKNILLTDEDLAEINYKE